MITAVSGIKRGPAEQHVVGDTKKMSKFVRGEKC